LRYALTLDIISDEGAIMQKTMKGAVLPGNSMVELKEFPVPAGGRGWEDLWDIEEGQDQ